jgi:uncharacterized protein YdeI (YjbR/CyaY-like superfamily)
MSGKTDPRVDAYIAKSAPFAQPILKHLRALVHRGCPDATETIKWSMPFFEYSGTLLCSMAAFKAHCAFGFWHQGMQPVLKQDGIDGESAMGGFGRIASIGDLPHEKRMLRYIQEAAKLNASGAPARSRPASDKPKKTVRVPADLESALEKNQAAAETFAKFSPSHRREYIEWITEAKRDETRQKRLATTLEWLAQGRSRNWKYER